MEKINKIFNFFDSGSGGIISRNGSADPDLYLDQNIADPQHCLRGYLSSARPPSLFVIDYSPAHNTLPFSNVRVHWKRKRILKRKASSILIFIFCDKS